MDEGEPTSIHLVTVIAFVCSKIALLFPLPSMEQGEHYDKVKVLNCHYCFLLSLYPRFFLFLFL